MASEPPPESVILSQFSGLRNTVTPERLGADELAQALNIDLDDAGQPSRRRGYTRTLLGNFHSIKTLGGRTYGVRNGVLGRLRSRTEFEDITSVGYTPVAYTAVNEEIYFCNSAASGVLDALDGLSPWGKTVGQGVWVSPVMTPTSTLGAVAGRLLGDPIKATDVESYRGRIYLADGKTLWATELFQYHYVDRTKGFMQFEHEITLVMSVDNGLYVGTTGGLYFLQGKMHEFRLTQINEDAVVRGTGVMVPADLVHPQARNQPMPAATSAVFMTTGGILAGFDNGTVYNLTLGKMLFPDAASGAALFRQDQGANTFVAAIDSSGDPVTGARMGDYLDAEIIRFRG